MDERHLEELLQKVKNSEIDIEAAMKKLKKLPYEDLGFAKLDNHRKIRQGQGEVIYCQGKTVSQISQIFERLLSHNDNVMGTRANVEIYNSVLTIAPDAIYDDMSKIIRVIRKPAVIKGGKILIATGGTSDMPVAEEAAVTAEFLGNRVERLYDVGVAGIHRLLMNTDKIDDASVIIAVAGMEGALASVVAGMASCPVVAVPTSIGYGANFGGLSALLTMLNSCASGIGVVNIDNGFGGGYLASMINHK